MEKIDTLKNVFQNDLINDQSKYTISSNDNIIKLMKIFEIKQYNNNEVSSEHSLEEIIYIVDFIKNSFLQYRINIELFNYYLSINNKNIYFILIDFYLYNKYDSPMLNNNILDIIDIIINNLDISKSVINFILQKFSFFFYALNDEQNENINTIINNKYEYFTKLLNILIHILGNNYKQANPKCYYFLTEKNNITIPIHGNNTNIGITLWLKYYLTSDKGEIFTIYLDKNNFIKLYFENNIFFISCNGNNYKIDEKEKKFLIKEWNCISLYYKAIKKKWTINFYLNGNQLLKDFCINNKGEKDIYVYCIKIGNNFYGELSSIIITNNNDNLFNLKIHKNLYNLLPFGITHYKYIKTFSDNFKDILPSIKYLYNPYAGKYNLINNKKNDLVISSNNNIHLYKSYYKKIYLLGGINIFLPIIELFYINIELCIEHNDLIKRYFDLISLIIKTNKKNMLDIIDNYFFMILSIFIENFPKELFTEELLNTFVELGKNIFNESKYCTLYLDYFNHILLNEKIYINFSDKLQIKLWQNFYEFFSKSHKVICPIQKISNILLNYDKAYLKNEEICCEEHYNCFIEEYKKIYANRKISKPNFIIKTEKIFLLYEHILVYTKQKDNEDRIKNVIEMLGLNVSPCFIIKILNSFNNIFTNENYKKYKSSKEEFFNTINNSKKYKAIIFDLLHKDYIDIKYATLSLIFNIYNYKPKEFPLSFKFIKNNILPKSILSVYNYNNFRYSTKDINILSRYCVDIINNSNTFIIYGHDDIICRSIFNFEYIYLNYTKIINLFLSYINDNQENIYEILDILLYINKNLNIELTIELINAINLYIVTNDVLTKNIVTFIPLLNYFLDTMLYYSDFDNYIFSSIYDFIINMLTIIKENKQKLAIIEYIIKYYSLIKNRGDEYKKTNIILNTIVNNVLNKLLTKICIIYINKKVINDNYNLFINLISILFNYIIIYNQDKTIYNLLKAKNIDALFPFFENDFSLLMFYINGLSIESNRQNNKDSNLLKSIWKDYTIVQNILDLFNEVYNINIYLDKKTFISIKEKIGFIFDNLIIKKDILKNDTIINIKKIFYYTDDINKTISYIKVIENIFEISIFLTKDINELKNLINEYIDFILYIIIISIRILPENINNKKLQIDNKLSDNDINNINQDLIFFSVNFLHSLLSTTTNGLINDNKNFKLEIINRFNEILYLCYLVYENGLFSKNINKNLLENSPPFYFFQYFFIKDENERKEKKNENFLKERKDKIDNLYEIINKDIFMQEKFYNYGKYYAKRFGNRYLNSEILINYAKNRLENDTRDYHHIYSENENYVLNFNDVKEKSDKIKIEIQSEVKNNLKSLNENLKTKKIYYKSLKKKLFMFNGPWSNFDIFYKDKKRLKYKIFNHYTKSLLRPFLKPILDINYYYPKFSKFEPNKLFNDNDIEKQKYKNICLDIDKILKTNNLIQEDFAYITNTSKEDPKDTKYFCCLVKVTHHIKGVFYIMEQGIMFKIENNNSNNKILDDTYDDIKKSCFGSYFEVYPKDKDIFHIAISYTKISYLFKRLYYYNETGLEIFTALNKNYYFNFKTSDIRNNIYIILCKKLKNQINNRSLNSIIFDWKNYLISNMELLMWLNIYSDRSYNDLSQYPVLPWILSDYSRSILNEKTLYENNECMKENLYRDLNLQLGMIDTNDNGLRKNDYIKNLEYSTQQNLENGNILVGNYALSERPFNYGSHYSNPIYVTNFLSRIFPFACILIELQGNKFDEPDRLFISVHNSYNCSITQKGDVRELIPEFYSIPEIYFNINNFDMGIRRNKEKVNNVKCPIWSEDNPFKFLTIINLAFESDYVSLNINNWIDLIYGYKQRGKEGEKCNNIYRFPSYADLVPIDQMNKDEKQYFYRFAEFGICPRQLFRKPFDKRLKPKQFKEIIDKNNMVITLDINDNKQNEENKKIVSIFPLEKEGIKILFNDFTGINFIKEKIKENVFRYTKKNFSYGHGLILNDKLLGNSKLDFDKIPFSLYNNGKYLIEGGFINGEMVISDLIDFKGYLLFNDYDHSPIIEIQINKEETIGIVGNLLGMIYIYKIKDYFWDYKIKLNMHNQRINCIFISDELNTFASCSNDNYINIFSLPTCKTINSFNVEQPEICILSSRPCPICIIYSNKNKKMMVFSVNGNLIIEKEIDKKPESSIIYTNKFFRDFLIFVNHGFIYFFSLPFLEDINKIKLIDENIYNDYDLMLKYYQNKNKNIENLIACDRHKKIIYIIGDN